MDLLREVRTKTTMSESTRPLRYVDEDGDTHRQRCADCSGVVIKTVGTFGGETYCERCGWLNPDRAHHEDNDEDDDGDGNESEVVEDHSGGSNPGGQAPKSGLGDVDREERQRYSTGIIICVGGFEDAYDCHGEDVECGSYEFDLRDEESVVEILDCYWVEA